MQYVGLRLAHEPDASLIPRAAPEAIGALAPSIKHRFVLALVVGASERETILRPNHECGPVPAGGGEGFLQRVKLRARHANVDGSLGDGKKVGTGLAQEFAKRYAQVVVRDPLFLAFPPGRRRRTVGHTIRGVAKDHVGQTAGHDFLNRLQLSHIAAVDSMVAEVPKVSRAADCSLRRSR